MFVGKRGETAWSRKVWISVAMDLTFTLNSPSPPNSVSLYNIISWRKISNYNWETQDLSCAIPAEAFQLCSEEPLISVTDSGDACPFRPDAWQAQKAQSNNLLMYCKKWNLAFINSLQVLSQGLEIRVLKQTNKQSSTISFLEINPSLSLSFPHWWEQKFYIYFRNLYFSGQGDGSFLFSLWSPSLLK